MIVIENRDFYMKWRNSKTFGILSDSFYDGYGDTDKWMIRY